MKQKTKKYFIGAVLALVIVLSSAFFVAKTNASVADNVAGWLWGGTEEQSDGNPNNGNSGYETNVGRISMNDTNPPAGGTGVYGVNIPTTDGSLSGYAWSENIGWISFQDDLVGCPAGALPARRVGNGLAGWARILSIKDAGTNSGGWQGCIRLAGTAQDGSPYGISIDPATGTIPKGAATSYAWSDELGWIDFSGATTVITGPAQTLKVCQNSCATGALVANNSTISLYVGNTKNLRACYNTAADCSDATGDVTATATWTETAGNTAASLSASGSNPKILTADNAGTEAMSVAYPAAVTQSFTVDVQLPPCACVPADQNLHCSGSNYTNSCGNTCAGKKSCPLPDVNYRETTPPTP